VPRRSAASAVSAPPADGDRRIPEVVIRRLPIYSRELAFLAGEDIRVISSLELGNRLRVTPAQIRKDLSYFGEFGKQGTGYDVDYLLAEINRILGLDREWEVVLVGVGHLGEAIAIYGGFAHQGFHIDAVFDADPAKIGSTVGEFVVRDVADVGSYIRERGILMGIVAVPAAAAQGVVDVMVESGVRGILNYAPISIRTPKDVQVRAIDPVVQLQSTTYYLKNLIPFGGNKPRRP
jgi:redox-sensing transcriptional repressor